MQKRESCLGRIVRTPPSRVQDFVSYCRLVKCAKESDGKHYGYSGNKIGNAHLKWAFSEAAVLSLRKNPAAQRYVARLAQQHGKAKALTILAHKLARAIYYMLHRGQAFDATRFFPLTTTPVRAEVEPDAPLDPAIAGARRRGARRPPSIALTANPPEAVMTATG